jgi:hypothetical protein
MFVFTSGQVQSATAFPESATSSEAETPFFEGYA